MTRDLLRHCSYHECVTQDLASSPGAGEAEALLPGIVLSARERQVLDLASIGLTNAEAGLELGISVHAVKFHLANVYRKLGVANRTEAAVRYLRHRDARRQVPG